mmetsp:Transcript_7027/g.22966  ORF Transcript_7027/g.22966 Transcript_7027/m.22966 type:complete len:155 (+) Transcript_7027:6119-6583(+)
MPKYSAPDDSDTQHLFVCRVIVGVPCKGRDGAPAPDVRNNETLELYDTTVDDVEKPSVYVTYNDHQAYPQYLVKFCQADRRSSLVFDRHSGDAFRPSIEGRTDRHSFDKKEERPPPRKKKQPLSPVRLVFDGNSAAAKRDRKAVSPGSKFRHSP